MDRSYQVYAHIVRILVLLLMLSSFLSCSKQDVVEEDYWVKIDDLAIGQAEVMIYAYQVYDEFINIGGENVWEFEDFSGGKSATEVARDAVLKNIVRIKTIQKKADEFRIELSEEQITASKRQGTQYYEQLPESFKQKHGITEERVHHVFLEFARASAVYNDLTSDLTPDEDTIRQRMRENQDYRQLLETSPKDLLTQIQVQEIFIPSDANDATEEVLNGKTFEELIDMYHQGDETLVTYTKATIPEAFEEELTNLEVGEISQVIRVDQGAYLFKLIEILEPSTEELKKFDENFMEFEAELRKKIINTLKSEHFDLVYEEWRRNTSVEINREQWGNVDFEFE